MSRHACILTLAALGAMAQEQAPPPAAGGAAGGGTGGAVGAPGGSVGTAPGRGTTTTPTPGRNDPFDPNNRNQQQNRFPDMERPIFLSGKVVMDDGTPPPEPVVIERVCNGQARPEGYTDSKGRFSFQLGQNSATMADASYSNNDFGGFPQQGGFGGTMNSNSSMGMGGRRGISERDLIGCELRANLAGYRSEMVNLSGRRMMDNPDVGTIILKPMANVEGKTFSMTSAMAPKDARKAYDKGVELLKKKKPAEAQREFEKATSLYPKYAIAWHELGRVYEGSDKKEDAMKAYQQAIAADSRFVKPYLQVASLAIGAQNWEQVAQSTDRIIKLNPIDFPQAYFFNSVAYYNLQKYEEAEKSAREAVQRDEKHRFPKAQHLLGILLAMKDDYRGAVDNIKGYLQFAPNAGDADAVKKQLSDFEGRLNASASAEQK